MARVPQATYVEVDGMQFPEEFRIFGELRTTKDETAIQATFTTDENGWPRLDAITFSRLPHQKRVQVVRITKPLEGLLAAAAAAHILQPTTPSSGLVTYSPEQLHDLEAEYRALLRKAIYTGNKPATKERAADVKRVAEEAAAHGEDPDAAIAKKYGVESETAAGWRTNAGGPRKKRGRPTSR